MRQHVARCVVDGRHKHCAYTTEYRLHGQASVMAPSPDPAVEADEASDARLRYFCQTCPYVYNINEQVTVQHTSLP
jgi:hypothetical protein